MPLTREAGLVTVAAIRRPEGEKLTEVLFNEKQRIFALPPTKSAEELSKLLEEALKKNVPVKAVLDLRRALVQKVSEPSQREIEEFRKLRIPLEKPDRIVPIDVASIDPTKFNIVDHYLKFRCFQLCARIVPNYMTAKKVFDFCAKQSCHLAGPKDIAPCIPFQYVRDGCYARAHKMRWIITTRFRYCCEKVFSFANRGNDRLAVKANKWGGCCVTWWYHVAPLIRVRVLLAPLKISVVLALVIDPGMFDKPVLLSTWLAAQENKLCSANAKVSMYSIQAGSAYWPTNHAGTSFGTDPAYVSTDYWLNAYKNLVTC